MSDPVVSLFIFPNPQVFRVGLALVGFDQTALSIFWSLDRGCKAQFIFSIMAIWLCSGIMYFRFYQDGYYVLDSYLWFWCNQTCFTFRWNEMMF